MMHNDGIDRLPLYIQVGTRRRQGHLSALQQFCYQRVDLVSKGFEFGVMVNYWKEQALQLIFQVIIPVRQAQTALPVVALEVQGHAVLILSNKLYTVFLTRDCLRMSPPCL